MSWVLAGLAAAAVPLMTTNTYYIYLAMTIGIFVVVTSGLNVLAGLTGQISLGHAGLYAIGAYAAALGATRLGLGLWSALPVAVALTAVVGAGLALAALRLSGPYLAMVTIAFGIIVEGALVEWVTLTGGPGGVFDIPKPALGGRPLALGRYYWIVALAAALALALTRNLRASDWGRALVAVKDSELAAESLGLSAYGLRTMAFTLSAAFAGAGGALFAFLNGYLSPDSFTLQTSILFLLIVLFGGLGTIAGPLIGGVALVVLPEAIGRLVDYRLALYGGLLLLSVYFLPRGVVGALTRRSAAAPPSSAPGAPDSLAWIPATQRGAGFRAATRDANTRALVVDHATRAFGGVRALDDVSLVVRTATVHGLIGPNGAGKTTLVNVMSGFDRADAGTVELHGERIGGRAPYEIARQGLVRTFQTPQLFDELTVLDNARVGAAGNRLGSLARAFAGVAGAPTAVRRAHAALEAAGLGEWAATRAGDLPFGHRRRLEIARALAGGARVLVLDEPAAGLAPAEVDALAGLLTQLRTRGVTVVLVEHHVDLVMAISDRVTVLDEGHVIADGEPAAIQQNPAVISAYLGASA